MSTYALAFLTLIRLVTPRFSPIRPALMRWGTPDQPEPSTPCIAPIATAGTALGLALAAFYILPAAYERRFVQIQMLVIEGMRVSDHFLFHRMPGSTPDDRFHDAVVRTASLIALTLLAAILAGRNRPCYQIEVEVRAVRHQNSHLSRRDVRAQDQTIRSHSRPEQGTDSLRFLANRRNPQTTLLPGTWTPYRPSGCSSPS